MKNKFCHFILGLSFCAMIGCKQDKPTSPANNISEKEIPADFLQFYMKFHSDSLFQLASINFPIDKMTDGVKWTEENWTIHKPFNDHDGNFTQTFKNLSGLIIEYINDTSGYFSMEKRYILRSEGYKLIYYHSENVFQNSEEWKNE